MSISISFGLNNTVEKPVEHYSTIDSILRDANLQQMLGFGANVEARVNGVSGVTHLQDGDEVTLVSRANSKGI